MDNYSLINNNSMNSLLDNQINNQLNSQFTQLSEPSQSVNNASTIQHTPVQQVPVNPPTVIPQQSTSLVSKLPRQVLNRGQGQVQGQGQVPAAPSGQNMGGNVEKIIKGVLSKSTKMILFYIVLSVSLMCAYSWSEAMKGIVKKYLRLDNHTEMDNVIYASVITLIVVVFVQILELAGANVSDIALKNIIGTIH